jgi:sugar phosphate isomerase/epimerase
LDELGIGIASVSYHGDVEPPAERRANQERTIRAAQWLGADIVVLNGERTVDRERQWPEHVRRFQALCRPAEEAGVVLAVEPEPLLVIASTQDMVEMLAAVDSPRLRVNLDVGHAQLTDENLADSVRRLGPAIVHLHLEDIRGRVHRHLPFGEGDIDFAALRRALAEIGYAGPYVADLFGLPADPAAVAAQALEGLRRHFGQGVSAE